MRKSSSSSTSFGDLMIFGSFLGASILAAAFVTFILMVVAWPVVAIFPVDSGAKEIVTALSLLWGVIGGCVVAVLTIGPWRRLQAHARVETFNDNDALPLEMIGRPIGARRRVANDVYETAANDTRPRRANRARQPVEEVLREEGAAQMPRRRPAGRRYRRAS
jgi:hypothetical protein